MCGMQIFAVLHGAVPRDGEKKCMSNTSTSYANIKDKEEAMEKVIVDYCEKNSDFYNI